MKCYEPKPFTINVDRQLLKDTKEKLRLARYPAEEVLAADDWGQGTKNAELKKVAEFWRDQFDWEAEEVCQKLWQTLSYKTLD
jgi:hypothetical protein